MLKHIIWDWNGTLLDDTRIIADIVDTILINRGLKPIGEKGYRELFSHPAEDFYRQCGLDLERHSFHDVVEEFHTAYSARFAEAALHQDSIDALEHFKNAGTEQHILSAHLHDSLEINIKHFGVRHYFSNVIGLDDGFARSKVGNGHLLVETCGAKPEDSVLIGDSSHDAEVADAIGIRCILVSGGIASKERLQRHENQVFEKLSDAIASLE